MMKQVFVLLRWSIPFSMVQALTSWIPDNKYSIKFRGWLSRPFIGKCGKNFTIASNVTINYPHKLEVGDNVYFAKGVWLNALGGMVIEREVLLAPYVVISTLQHGFKNGSVWQGGSTFAPVIIKKGSWLAAHVSVKCGVVIEKGNLIGANSFVVSNTEEYGIYGGVPAKLLKKNTDSSGEITSASELL